MSSGGEDLDAGLIAALEEFEELSGDDPLEATPDLPRTLALGGAPGGVVEQLGHPDGVLIVDETGFVKKGTRSVGVQRQYSGTAGRVENCQLGVFLAYASPVGRALIDRALYLPKAWLADRARCQAAGVPTEVEFATKPALAMGMLGRALDAGVPARWVTADEAYGQDSKFRRFLDRRHIGYVVAVPRSQPIGTGLGASRADTLAEQAPPAAWKRLSAGAGAKGPRRYDWALAALAALADPDHAYHDDEAVGWGRWLLLRRHRSRSDEVRFYLCAGPADTPIDQLVKVAGAAGRSRPASSRQRPRSAGSLPGPPLPALVPPYHPGHARPRLPRRHRRNHDHPKSPSDLAADSPREIRRLLAHLTDHRRPLAFHLTWSVLRRRLQARARHSHYRRHHTKHHKPLL